MIAEKSAVENSTVDFFTTNGERHPQQVADIALSTLLPKNSPIQKWIGDEPSQKWIGYMARALMFLHPIRDESKIGSITRNRLLTNVNHNPKLDRAYQARHINGLEVGSKLSPAITNSKLSPLINDLHQNSKLSPDQN